MKLKLPRIYPITDTRITNLSHAEQVKRLIEGGAEFIQLREKHASSEEFFYQAKEAIELAKKHEVKIIINDRVDIALALKADGVHLGQDDLPPAEARKILGEDAIIGFSTHTVSQAVEAVRLSIDYVAIGPIFSTTTKENPDEVVDLKGVGEVFEAIGDFPLVAIGGITLDNFREVLGQGANSVAVISDLISPSENIKLRLKEFLTK